MLVKVCLTISTVHPVEYVKRLGDTKNDLDILVIDEGQESVRLRNRKILDGMRFRFFGPKERRAWLRESLGSRSSTFLQVLAPRSRGENSLAFLRAATEGADVIIELDDDVFPEDSFVDDHVSILRHGSMHGVRSRHAKWYNTLRSLKLRNPYRLDLFPRGHPYSAQTRLEDYEFLKLDPRPLSLNMGHWTGHPDLDAVTILACGGVDGRCGVLGHALRKSSLVVGKGTYFSVCSMNASFTREVVPAMYQLYMSCMGVDRFDDIWSGIFLKKIADHLGARVGIGAPVGEHRKTPRPIFNDVIKEANGLSLNEDLWRVVDEFELEGKDYWTCYRSLCHQLSAWARREKSKFRRDFLGIQTKKMDLWLRLVDLVE
jgi:hypothetical protein